MAAKKNALIIVESPTKAKTISKFVGPGFTVKSSFGHVRDLPKRMLGIDVDQDFAPKYVVPLKAKSVVSTLKKDAAKASRVILATDEDREGEAIAWHLAEVLGLVDEPTEGSKTLRAERITFDEITKKAILKSLESPRSINRMLVDAQQGRRVLDRLVGYKLSPLLWKKISKGLSAGRVQSVALRFVVDRERERQAFTAEEYWTVEAVLAKGDLRVTASMREAEELPDEGFLARLWKIGGKPAEKFALTTREDAEHVARTLEGAAWRVTDVKRKEVRRNPFPPFTTSTLQQTAGRRYGFSSKQTMRLAQGLYEGTDLGEEGTVGLITYMRTDSVNLSQESLDAARAFIVSAYGEAYAEDAPRRYANKSKLVQEAHEAIRPTDPARTPESLKAVLEPRAWKLYDLIWRRFVASQMPQARFAETAVSMVVGDYEFEARGIVKQFDGYQRVYPVKIKEVMLPALEAGDALTLVKLLKTQHFTEPPARFNESSLIKALEENGIGRPSTYAPTLSLIQDRGYVKKDEKRAFVPTEVGYAVNDLLVEHFPLVVDAAFTAKMEGDLDRVASGEATWQEVIREFYEPFAKNLAEKQESIVKMVEETSEVCEKCGKPMIIRMGRFGRFLACSGFPDCKNTKPLPGSEDDRASAAGPGTANESGGTCEKCGAPLMLRRGRFGVFWGCSRYPDCTYIKKKSYAIGVKCPKCHEGDIVSRRTKTRRIFYGCSRYPECDYATWERPAVPGETPATGPTVSAPKKPVPRVRAKKVAMG